MTSKHIRELLHARPFVPFRIHLTDGSTVGVPHPDFAWAHGGRVYVAKGPETDGAPWDSPGCHMLYLLHVARVETDGPMAQPESERTAA